MSARSAAGIACAVALLIASGAAVASAPDSERITAPIEVRGGVGDILSSRLLTAQVSQVRLADYLDVKYRDAGDTSTDGVWVVIDLTLTPRERTITYSDAQLRIGDDVYTHSLVLPAPTLYTMDYGAGIPERGSWVFELPMSALEAPGASSAVLVLQTQGLDSTPAVRIDLTSIEIRPRVRIDEPMLGELP